MKINSPINCTLLALVAVFLPAVAYEGENAVPLMLGLDAGKVKLENISIKLEGREVTVSTELINNQTNERRVGWYASTPQFGVLGDGEEHLNKSFADVRGKFNGRPRKPVVYHRGYFMGRDITEELAKAGLGPLPNLLVDGRKMARVKVENRLSLENWRGYAAYAWSAKMPSNSSATFEFRYQALPEFSLNEIDSDLFSRAVLQHCGSPEEVRRRIRFVAGAVSEVMVESYQLPVSFMLMRDVFLTIAQPSVNWQKARPILAMACGLQNTEQVASVSGTVTNSNLALSVLVVSALGVPALEVKSDGR